MRRNLLLALVAGVAALPACDVVVDPRPDSERIVGAWAASSANVRVTGIPVGIPVADLTAAGDVQTFTFNANGTFSFVFDPDDARRLRVTYNGTTYLDIALPDGPVMLSGTYALDASGRRITFSTIAGQTADDFVLQYRFGTFTDSVELIAEDPATLALLFGIAGDDYAVFAQWVTGGSVSYARQ